MAGGLEVEGGLAKGRPFNCVGGAPLKGKSVFVKLRKDGDCYTEVIGVALTAQQAEAIKSDRDSFKDEQTVVRGAVCAVKRMFLLRFLGCFHRWRSPCHPSRLCARWRRSSLMSKRMECVAVAGVRHPR